MISRFCVQFIKKDSVSAGQVQVFLDAHKSVHPSSLRVRSKTCVRIVFFAKRGVFQPARVSVFSLPHTETSVGKYSAQRPIILLSLHTLVSAVIYNLCHCFLLLLGNAL